MTRALGLILLAVTIAAPAASQTTPVSGPLNRRAEALRLLDAGPGAVYRRHCAPCHGEEARGQGTMWASELPAKPADLTALAGREARVLAVIRDGTASEDTPFGCPPFGRSLSSPDVERLGRRLAATGRKEPTTKTADPVPSREPLPWFLILAIAGELTLIVWMLRHARST